MYPKLTSESVRQEQEELDIRTLHLLRAIVHNEERKLPENWDENPAEHKKYGDRTHSRCRNKVVLGQGRERYDYEVHAVRCRNVNVFESCCTFSLQCSDTVGLRQEGYPTCKKLGISSLVVTIRLEVFAHLITPVVTTTSIIFSSSKMQNGIILVPPNPGSPGKNGR